MRFWRGKAGSGGGEAGRLKAAAVALGREMEAAGFGLAAAYAGLAADALEDRLPADWGQSWGAAGAGGEEATAFEVDEHGRVWAVRGALCEMLGRREEVAAAMRMFLASPPK
jgi:hypothetical protein